MVESANLLVRFYEYKLYMAQKHPSLPRLSYRDWLDFGHRE